MSFVLVNPKDCLGSCNLARIISSEPRVHRNPSSPQHLHTAKLAALTFLPISHISKMKLLTTPTFFFTDSGL